MTTSPVTSRYIRGRLALVGDRWHPVPGDPRRGSVILLHGVGQTRHSWRHIAQRLASHGWDVIALDARGHGDSDWAPADGYTFDEFVGDLVHVASGLDESPVLVGASMGGLTALLAQAEHRLGSALVLVDIAIQVKPEGTRRILQFMASHLDGFATLGDAADAISAYNPRRARPDNLDGLRKNFRQGPDGRWYWLWDPRLVGQMADPTALVEVMRRIGASAHHVTVPTLVLRGEMSDLIDEQSVTHLLRRLPTARTTTIGGTGHMIAGDDQDAFAATLLDFLQTAPRTPQP